MRSHSSTSSSITGVCGAASLTSSALLLLALAEARARLAL
jgi:hypothetical protein